jgi:hypothetical protein
MVDDMIAIAAIVEILLTAFLMIQFRPKPFPFPRLLFGLVIFAILVSILPPAFLTPGRSAPFNLLVVTCLCFSLSCTVPLAKPAFSLALLGLTITMLVMLPCLANRQKDYTFLAHVETRKKDSLYFALEEIPHQERSFPAGWLADQPFAAEIPERSMQGQLYIPHPLWHSRFSGIYRLEIIEGEAWYPGRPLKDGRWKIEIRER